MSLEGTSEKPRLVADHIPGYDYGSPTIAQSPVRTEELELLKRTAGFTAEDEQWLREAGNIMADQTKQLVEKWRAAIAAHPHLARYSQRPDGSSDVRYGEASGLRLQQWVLDTCLRPYNQDWLNYSRKWLCATRALKRTRPITWIPPPGSTCGMLSPSML